MKHSLSMAARVWVYYAMALLLCLFFVSGTENNAFRIVLNAALLLGFLLLIFNEGGYRGEKACTLAASLEKQVKDGRKVDAENQSQCWSKPLALRTFAVCLAPFVLIAALNLAVAPMYPVEESAPAEQTENLPSSQTYSYNEEDAAKEASGPINWVGVTTRLVYMPYVCAYSMVSVSVLNWLFLLFAIPFPTAWLVGYLMGPKLRDRKLKDIAKGKRRKMRANKTNKAPKPPKAEV